MISNDIGLDVSKQTISYSVKDVSGRGHSEGAILATSVELYFSRSNSVGYRFPRTKMLSGNAYLPVARSPFEPDAPASAYLAAGLSV